MNGLTEDTSNGSPLGDMAGCLSAGEYCDSMVEYLRESHQLISRLLEAADFDGDVPYVFGHPDVVGAEVMVQNEAALLLYKAQIHLTVVLRAHRSSNLHSLAVHARVILECAGQIHARAKMVHGSSPEALANVLNAHEYDFMDTFRRVFRGSIPQEELLETVIAARSRIGDSDTAPPSRVRVSDRVAHLPGGGGWHQFLSERFCGDRTEPLSCPSMLGGVVPSDTEADRMAIAFLLDYLAQQTILMIFSYGVVVIGVTGDSRPFDDASDLLDRMKADAAPFRAWLASQHDSEVQQQC